MEPPRLRDHRRPYGGGDSRAFLAEGAPATGEVASSQPSPINPDYAALERVRGIQHGAILHQGRVIWERQGWREDPNNASCARAVIADSCWLNLFTKYASLREKLYQPISELHTKTAATFAPHIRLCDPLWYIGDEGRWHYSEDWRIMDDLFYELTGEKLHDYFNKYIALHGIWASENKDDGTPRFSASSIAAAGWGVFMLAALKGEDWRIDAGLARLAISGGPLGDGKPFHLEGMGGIHLFRNGEGWDEPHLRLPGVPDGFSARDGSEHADHGHGYIACFPQYDLVIAVRGATIEWSLPDLCEALHLS